MKRAGNVLPFPSDNPSGNSLKLFAIVFYLFVAFVLTFGLGMSEDGLGVLIVLGLMYNFFVRNRVQGLSYFKNNAVLLIILLVLFIVVFKYLVLMLLALAGVYWFMVGRTGRDAPYFLRFHMLTALILNFFLLLPVLFINALVGLFFALSGLAKMSAVIAPVAIPLQQGLPLVFMGCFWGAAIWLSISVMMGRTPYIPLVTDNVRPWA